MAQFINFLKQFLFPCIPFEECWIIVFVKSQIAVSICQNIVGAHNENFIVALRLHKLRLKEKVIEMILQRAFELEFLFFLKEDFLNIWAILL